MRNSIVAIAVLGALTCAGPAWAVLKETTVTITDDQGQPLPNAKISLTVTEQEPQPPREPQRPQETKRLEETTPAVKPTRPQTDSDGKITLQYDDERLTAGASVDIVVRTDDRTYRRRNVPFGLLLAGGPIDMGRGTATASRETRPVEPVSSEISVPQEPRRRASRRTIPPAPGWQGSYLGAGGGGRWTQCPDFNNVLTSVSQFTQTNPVSQFNQTNPSDSGFVNFVVPRGTDNRACGSSGARGSIMLGTNWQAAPRWILGLEGDVGLANSQGTINTIPGTSGIIVPAALAGNDSIQMKEGWDAGLRGRLGFAVTPAALLFGTAGIAWQRVQVTMNCTATGTCGANGIPAFSASASTTMTGWSVGGGIDVKLLGNWIARGEYRYADYGTWRTTLASPAGPTGLAVTTDIMMRTHIGLFGLAYTFAGSPPLP